MGVKLSLIATDDTLIVALHWSPMLMKMICKGQGKFILDSLTLIYINMQYTILSLGPLKSHSGIRRNVDA